MIIFQERYCVNKSQPNSLQSEAMRRACKIVSILTDLGKSEGSNPEFHLGRVFKLSSGMSSPKETMWIRGIARGTDARIMFIGARHDARNNQGIRRLLSHYFAALWFGTARAIATT